MSLTMGSKAPSTQLAMLAERADLASFTGDVMDWVRERITTAQLVVADLTGANPNVYLEVGYAWGKGIPTVLRSKGSDALSSTCADSAVLSTKQSRS